MLAPDLTAFYANGVTSSFVYNDQRGWLNGLTHANSGGTLQQLSYARAATGRISGVSNAADATETWSYGYDDLDRLLSSTNGGNASLNETFTYDNAGNITYKSDVGTYTYPLGGSPRPHAPLTAGSRTFAYDANGNTTSDGARAFTYDGENRATASTASSTPTPPTARG